MTLEEPEGAERPNSLKSISRMIVRRIVPKQLRAYVSDGLRSLRYRGSAVLCPCCGHGYKKFAPFGLEVRENAMCHNCGALERHRFLWLFLTRELHLFDQPQKVLHFAPEPALFREFLEADNIHYFPCDLEPQNLHPSVRKMDITDIRFDD